MKVKKFLNDILQEVLEPIRNKRCEYQKNIKEVYEILYNGSKKAREKAILTTSKVKEAMGINYFEDEDLIKKHIEKYQ